MCILCAVTYGVLHDQVTARVCVEYFTIGHAPIFPTEDPTLLGLGWGVIATWWVGFLLGVPLAFAARAGNRPKRDVASLLRPVVWLLAGMAACALIAGVVGWVLASNGTIALHAPLRLGFPSRSAQHSLPTRSRIRQVISSVSSAGLSSSYECGGRALSPRFVPLILGLENLHDTS